MPSIRRVSAVGSFLIIKIRNIEIRKVLIRTELLLVIRLALTAGVMGALLLSPGGGGAGASGIVRPWQAGGARPGSPDGVWVETAEQGRLRRFLLNGERLRQRVEGVAREGGRRVAGRQPDLSIPLPDGRYGQFRLEESPAMEPELAAKFPEIRSYRGTAADGSGATMRLDISPRGVHAFLLIEGRTVVVHPAFYARGDARTVTTEYLSYDYGEYGTAAGDLTCAGMIIPEREQVEALTSVARPSSIRTGETLRTFRLALATTQEFTNATGLGGGTVSGTIAALNTLVNSINAIYERELSIRFTLVASNDQIVYTAEPDPFSNLDTTLLVSQASTVLRDRIGAANYDLGLVLGTGGGGMAMVGVVCDNTGQSGPNKGSGTSSASSSGPVTTGTFNLAHEIGHQFNAMHSFNTSCGGARNPEEAWESASGLTIMAYPGACSPDRIVTAPDMRFHGGTLLRIRSFIEGLSCGTSTATGNQSPTVDGGPDYVIPKNTPFLLAAVGADSDSSDLANLTYAWEQYDAGGSAYANPPYIDSSDPSTTTRPIFRPFPATSSPRRVFPSLTYILNNANDPPFSVNNLQTAEELPRIGRSLNFVVTARDNRGGVATDAVTLSVSGSAGPFQVTSPNTTTTLTGGSDVIVQWAVAGTNVAPVNCTDVRILLSTDGGNNFPLILAQTTPNNGSATVTVPAFLSTTTARIKIEAIGNIFFDVSDTNLTITPPSGAPVVNGVSPLVGNAGMSVVLTGVNFTGTSQVIFSGNAVASFVRNSSTQITATVPAGAVTGPIRIVKSGYNDVLSPVFTVCTSPPTVLSVDDGGRENAYGNSGINHYVNRITPSSYPATLTGVYLNLNLASATSIEVVAGVNTDGDSNIDGTVFQSATAQTGTRNASILYAVAPITINAGDFVIGVRYTPQGGALPANVDETPPLAGRSYLGTGTTFSLLGTAGTSTDPGNLMIRGQVYEGTCVFCAYATTPATQSIGALGGQVTATVAADSGCGWQSASYNSWITINSGAYSAGSGQMGYTVAANSSFTPRSGNIVVAGQYINVVQAGRCSIDIDQATLTGGTVGAAYSRTLTALNGKAPLVFSLTNGSIPPGVQLSSGGVLSGIPTAPGTYIFSISVTDANFCIGQQDYAINIACPAIAIEPTLLPAGTIKSAYSQTMTQIGGVGTVSWTSTGALPPGLSLNSSTGLLSGAPTATGTFSFTIYATDSNGCFGGQSYSLVIGCQTLSLLPTMLPNGAIGAAYSQQITQTDGVGNIAWSSSGTLPPGLSINPSTGYLEGVPTTTGSFSFKLRATDGNGCFGERDYQMSIGCQTITVSPQTLTGGTINVPFSQSLSAGAISGTITWTVSGTLPPGITFNTTNGTLSGSPTALGSYSFTIRAADANGCFGEQIYQMAVGCQAITIGPTSLPSGKVNSSYSETATQSGGSGAIIWSLTGSLPAGLTLNTGSGLISGIPTANGSFNLTIRATDVNGCFGERDLSLVIGCQAITILPVTLPAATVNSDYDQLFTWQGAVGGVTWSAAGSLPPGLSLNAESGTLTGKPTTIGSYRFTIRATDGNGCQGERGYEVVVGCQAVTVGPGNLPAGTVATAYSQMISAINSIGTVAWSVTGSLPSGLSLNTTSGELSGTPGVGGNYTFTIRATDANGCFGEQEYTLAIACQTIAISPATMPGAQSGIPFSLALSQTGGLGTLVWSRTGRFPAGLSLDTTTGLLSGTLAEVGTFNFTIYVSDEAGCLAERSYALTVTCSTLSIGPATLPGAANGVAYTQPLSQTNGVSTITWSVTGSLPPGLTVNPQTGVLSGAPTETGSFNFTVRATDANGCFGERSYTLPVACPTIDLGPVALPNAATNNAYSQTLMPSAGAAPFAWSITAGLLPAGFTLDTVAGKISGTTIATGSYSFTIKVTDASGCAGERTYQLEVVCPTITIGPASLTNGTVGAAYSRLFTQSGSGGTITWTISGVLPSGMTFDPVAASLTGTPTVPGDFAFTLRATDGSGCFAEKSYQLKIDCQSIAVGPATLPQALLLAPYSQTLTASGGIGTTTLALTGSLPPGITFNPLNGRLEGTPTQPGTYRFTVGATDSNNCYGERTWDMVVACQAINVTPTTISGGVVGAALTRTFIQTGGSGTIAWSVTGNLPDGLALDATSGQLSGTPTSAGSFALIVRATDSNGCFGERSYTLVITCQSIDVTPATLPIGSVNTAYSTTFVQSGGVGTIAWSVIGDLPAGLTFDSSTGRLSGTPTVAGFFSLVIKATDANGCFGQRALQLTIACQAITLSPTTLPAGSIGTAYNQTVTQSGGVGTITWSASGTLPAGLIFNTATQTIVGTPVNPGSSTFSLRATDANGCFGERQYTLTIACPAITITPQSIANGTVSTPYSQLLGQTGGTGTIVWVAAGSLPAGLTINANTGLLSGTPTTTGSFNFTVRAIDSKGCYGERSYQMLIACPTIALSPASLPAGTAGTAYSQQLVQTAGVAPITWSTTGSLPPGLTLNSSTGLLSGTPTAIGTFNFDVRATDANSCFGSLSYQIVIGCPTIVITPIVLSFAPINVDFSLSFTQSGGVGSISWNATGNLPPGLSLDSSTGVLTGTPTSTGTYTFTLRATDGNLCFGERIYTLLVTDGSTPIFEGDVSPRPNGDNNVSVTDWVQVGRFAVSLDQIGGGTEFMRADNSPILTFGNGTIDVSDWVQAGRYAVGLDPLSLAAGPSSPVTPAASPTIELNTPTPRLPGRLQPVIRPTRESGVAGAAIQFEASGGENGLAFTLRFDPRIVTLVDASSDSATVILNRLRERDGMVAIALALPPGTSFARGLHHPLTLRFLYLPGREGQPFLLDFDDSLIPRQLVSVEARHLPLPIFTPTVISGSALFSPTIPWRPLASASPRAYAAKYLENGGLFRLPIPFIIRDCLGVKPL